MFISYSDMLKRPTNEKLLERFKAWHGKDHYNIIFEVKKMNNMLDKKSDYERFVEYITNKSGEIKNKHTTYTMAAAITDGEGKKIKKHEKITIEITRLYGSIVQLAKLFSDMSSSIGLSECLSEILEHYVKLVEFHTSVHDSEGKVKPGRKRNKSGSEVVKLAEEIITTEIKQFFYPEVFLVEYSGKSENESSDEYRNFLEGNEYGRKDVEQPN